MASSSIKKGLTYEFKKGLWTENAVIKLLLGMCPALAVSNSATNGLAMGLASTFVVMSASTFVSIIRRIVPKEVRIPTYIVIIAGFVTLADLFLKAYFPPISKSLGPYVPLIVVNCMIMGRAEFFASKHTIPPSLADALGTGLGFTWVLVLMGAIREVLGSGAIFGYVFMGEDVFTPWVVMILPAGAFITLGLLIGFINFATSRKSSKGACS
ncbi:MAG: electron transport complex subunit E [Deltaproteobacteria bacterium]|nr:electron transport complex subunit E [Deltaproteobacteria bacterium]